MTDSTEPNEETSLFDVAVGGAGASDAADRVQELKRMLFDLSYLIMNVDGTEHISEQMLVQKLEQRMEREGSVNVDARADELAPLLDEGPDAIRERVLELADRVAEKAGDRVEGVGDRYLDFLRGLIVADASVADEEHALFEALCDHWGVEKELPA